MRKILGWGILILVAADLLFTYFDNHYGTPPSPLTTWVMDTGWRIPGLIALWICGLFCSLALITRGPTAKD